MIIYFSEYDITSYVDMLFNHEEIRVKNQSVRHNYINFNYYRSVSKETIEEIDSIIGRS